MRLDWSFIAARIKAGVAAARSAVTLGRSLVRRLVKGALLSAWLIVLIGLASWAASGKAGKEFIEAFEQLDYAVAYESIWQYRHPDEMTPNDFLVVYLKQNGNAAPIESVLDSVAPRWREVNLKQIYLELYFPNGEDNINSLKLASIPDQYSWIRGEYFNLFGRVDRAIRGHVHDLSRDPNAFSLNGQHIIPTIFLAETDSPSVVMPAAAAAWINNERERILDQKNRVALVNTFLLLIVLGAFGSIIFLTRDFITIEPQTPLAAYIFRPVLGILLAIAVFVVDVLAHALVSEADILQIRHETLYVLALAAGLLSDQVYLAIGERAKEAVERLRGADGGGTGDAGAT